MRLYAARVTLEACSGDVIRHIPGPLAKAMVEAGGAIISNANGKVKAIRLVQSATSHAVRIGEPSTGMVTGTRFVRREMLPESGTRVWAFHPRSFQRPPR